MSSILNQETEKEVVDDAEVLQEPLVVEEDDEVKIAIYINIFFECIIKRKI